MLNHHYEIRSKPQGGERPESTDKEKLLIRVADYMANKLVTFSVDQNMHEVIKTPLISKISGAPVVNNQNELAGVGQISQKYIMKAVLDL